MNLKQTFVIFGFSVLVLCFGCQSTEHKNSRTNNQITSKSISSSSQKVKSDISSLVETRDRLLTSNYLRSGGGGGFSRARLGIRYSYKLYRDAGKLAWTKTMSDSQRRELALIQLESIAFAARLENYLRANLGKTEDDGYARESKKFADFFTDTHPRSWPQFQVGYRFNDNYYQRLDWQSVTENTHPDYIEYHRQAIGDPAIASRVALIFLDQNEPYGLDLLASAIEKNPNDVHVRSVAAQVAGINSDTGQKYISVLPKDIASRSKTMSSIITGTERVASFWINMENEITKVIKRRNEYIAELRRQGICITCEGNRKVVRTKTTYNGFSTILGSSSEVIDCPTCRGSGRFH